MKDYKKSMLTNEKQTERSEGIRFENSNTGEEVNEKQDTNNSSLSSLNNQSIFRRYSFDDNGGGYQGL